MAQQVLSVNKFAVIIFLLLVGCTGKHKEPLPYFNTNSINLENNNGLAFKDSKPFSGIVFLLSENKDTVEIAGFREGKEDGEWKKFYPGNKLKEQRYFDQGIKSGIYTAWWPDGTKRFEYPFDKGEYHGTYREWNENGVLIREMNYAYGHESGSQKQYYDNGKVKANYVVKDGKRYGLLGTKNCVNVAEKLFKK